VRRLRRLLILALLLLTAFVIVDGLAAEVASRGVADRVQEREGLRQRPEIEIRGFPFLTQAARGRYDKVGVTLTGVERSELRVQSIEATLYGVRLPLRAALNPPVGEIPVQRAQGSARLSFADLERRAGGGLTLSREGSALGLRGSVEVLGRDVEVNARARLSVAPGGLRVQAEDLQVAGLDGGLPAPVGRAVLEQLSFTAPLPALPFPVELTDVAVGEDVIVISGRARDLVLSSAAPGTPVQDGVALGSPVGSIHGAGSVRPGPQPPAAATVEG